MKALGKAVAWLIVNTVVAAVVVFDCVAGFIGGARQYQRERRDT